LHIQNRLDLPPDPDPDCQFKVVLPLESKGVRVYNHASRVGQIINIAARETREICRVISAFYEAIINFNASNSDKR